MRTYKGCGNRAFWKRVTPWLGGLALALIATTRPASANVCVKAAENSSASLACPSGQVVSNVVFASYGTPSGPCGTYALSSCNSSSSLSNVKASCLGKASCSISASNSIFGDPCNGVVKSLAIEVQCATPAAVTTVASGAVKSGLGTNVCLDVTAGSPASGAALEIWSCNGGSNQSFVLNSAGQLKSFAGAGNLCVDIQGTGANLNPIVSKTCNNSATQKWSLSNGRLVNASSGRCIDVTANNTANGTSVILYDCAASANQQWSFASGAAPSPTPTPSPSPSPTVKPSPTPSPSPTSTSSTGLTIDEVVKDMSSQSEALVINPSFNWQYSPVITQYSPAGSSIASWWTGERPTWCYGLLAWYTLYEAQGNTATNTRVEIKNLRVYILSNSKRTWSLWGNAVAPDTGLWKYPFDSAGTPDRKIEADGGVSFRPAYPYFEHGYGTSLTPGVGLPNPADVRAVFVAVDMRLVVADPSKPDDRSVAKYVVDTGADYYPDATYKQWSLGYAPGVGNGRYHLVTPNWRTATLIVPNKDQGATMTEFLSNPPPLK